MGLEEKAAGTFLYVHLPKDLFRDKRERKKDFL